MKVTSLALFHLLCYGDDLPCLCCSTRSRPPVYIAKDVSILIQVHQVQRLTAAHSFHVDHAASLPYVLAKTNFKGRVFMTHPTKAIYKWLIQDSVRVQ